MDAETIRAWDVKARAGFNYQPDPPDDDTWRSHAPEVLDGMAWADDCDGLTSTVLDLLSRFGVPLSGLYRLICSTKDGKTPDHMIGCVWDDVGACWVVGDTFGACYPARDCPHVVLEYASLDAPDTRHQGAPWG